MNMSDEPLAMAMAKIQTLIRERDDALAEIERLRDAINIDRSGLAAGLMKVRKLCEGWGWLSGESWGSYSWEQHTTDTLRIEIGECLVQIDETALEALGRSGDLAVDVLRNGSIPSRPIDPTSR